MKAVFLSVVTLLLAACGGNGDGGGSPPFNPPGPPPPNVNAPFQDVSATNLPQAALGGMCMDVDHGDVDGDGDIDLALAQEFATNIVLLNDGTGVFSFGAGAVNGGDGDNEDVRLRDFDGDADLDMLTVHEDDAVHSLLINDGSGVFTADPARIPTTSIANATEVIDLDADTRPDILLGNRGQNITLLQQASGVFLNATAARPIGVGVTQDLLLLDIDGDADLDLMVVNEGANRLLVNNGSGFFTDESQARLPGLIAESREADAADIDNDGDLDMIVGNIGFQQSQPLANNLLINDGNGVFADATASNLANVSNNANSFTIRFADIDADGDPDILSPENNIGSGGNASIWINDGTGNFETAADSPFSVDPSGSIFDIEVADLNGDGKDDIYFCYRTGTDQLYLQQ